MNAQERKLLGDVKVAPYEDKFGEAFINLVYEADGRHQDVLHLAYGLTLLNLVEEVLK